MDDATPFVSVIVPALNEERTIRECIVSLLRMDYPQERREILMVDNGSTDRTAEIIKSFPVRYLREERRGASYARNRGIEASKGEILAFTDADCVVTTGWLRELVRGFEDEGVGSVEGETVAYPPVTPIEQHQARMGVTPIGHDPSVSLPRLCLLLMSPFTERSSIVSAYSTLDFQPQGERTSIFRGGSSRSPTGSYGTVLRPSSFIAIQAP